MRPVAVRWAFVDDVEASDVACSGGLAARLAATRDPVARQSVVAARLLLRWAVAEWTGESDVVVVQVCGECGGPHGRPSVVVAGRPGPAVSLAHAGGLAVVAVSGVPVGVDVERAEPGVREWVRTEAVLKATGHGLTVDPSLVDLGDDRVRAWRGPGRSPCLRVADVALESGHTIAVARFGRRRLRMDVRHLPLGGRPTVEAGLQGSDGRTG